MFAPSPQNLDAFAFEHFTEDFRQLVSGQGPAGLDILHLQLCRRTQAMTEFLVAHEVRVHPAQVQEGLVQAIGFRSTRDFLQFILRLKQKVRTYPYADPPRWLLDCALDTPLVARLWTVLRPPPHPRPTGLAYSPAQQLLMATGALLAQRFLCEPHIILHALHLGAFGHPCPGLDTPQHSTSAGTRTLLPLNALPLLNPLITQPIGIHALTEGLTTLLAHIQACAPLCLDELQPGVTELRDTGLSVLEQHLAGCHTPAQERTALALALQLRNLFAQDAHIQALYSALQLIQPHLPGEQQEPSEHLTQAVTRVSSVEAPLYLGLTTLVARPSHPLPALTYLLAPVLQQHIPLTALDLLLNPKPIPQPIRSHYPFASSTLAVRPSLRQWLHQILTPAKLANAKQAFTHRVKQLKGESALSPAQINQLAHECAASLAQLLLSADIAAPLDYPASHS